MLLLVCLSSTHGQSLDPNAPSPVSTNTLEGRIAARDLGDARLTDHYYAFTGVPGDLVITVQARNLNGDIDVFTAGTLRPLLKLTLYAESTTPVTKGIYLRRREDLILRVEARSPNDDEGTYQLSFSGAFEPVARRADTNESEAVTPAESATTTPGSKTTRRVSSVGARIEEPMREVAAAPTPEPTPAPTPESKPAEPVPSEKTTSANTTATTPRTARGRRPTTRRTQPASTKPKETITEKKETAATIEGESEIAVPESKPKPATTAKRSSSRSAKPPNEPPVTEPPPDTGPRLLIETNDGTMINRSMSAVKRVMVENGQVVVVGKDGRVDRFLLANVVRMSIAP